MSQQIASLVQNYPIPASFLVLLGSLSVLSFAYRFSLFVFRKFIRPSQNLRKRYGQNGSWAVVTGASDGIGKAFCESFAQRGFNICLISRNLEKLSAVRDELRAKYPKIQAEVVVADFCQSPKDPDDFYTRISNELSSKNINDIAILVNNAGYSEMDHFDKIGFKDISDMISVNVYPVAFLTRVLVPKMLSRPQKSLVISLASVTAVYPFSYLGIYGATKAFNNQLSKGLAMEYQGKIDFLSLRPNYVSSKMTKLKPGGFVISPRACAEGCLRDAGWDTETGGNWKHEGLEWLIRRILPQSYIQKKSKGVMKRIEERKKKQ